MALLDNIRTALGSAWHVGAEAFYSTILPAVDGTPETSKLVTTDANNKVASLDITAPSFGGTALAATGAEINRVADRSTRAVAAGATLALTEAAHDGKTILLDTAAGSVVTLPAPVIGMRTRFLVTVKPTSNYHQIKVAAATDFMAGVVNILDLDGAAQGAFQADGAADDNIQLNGTTKGGQVGDWLEIEGISATQWAIRGDLAVPAGSDPADMFSAAVS